jgi:hypothetical protein
MSVGTADFQKAIVTAWDASGLNDTFKALWETGVTADDFPVLHEQEASPDQPFPYCVMELDRPAVESRMYGGEHANREIRRMMLTFNVHAKRGHGGLSAKQVAASLADSLMELFGGHPTVKSQASIELDNGAHLQTQYQTDYPVRTPDYGYQWVVLYQMLVDVPVAV